jgi:hypothetical protein
LYTFFHDLDLDDILSTDVGTHSIANKMMMMIIITCSLEIRIGTKITLFTRGTTVKTKTKTKTKTKSKSATFQALVGYEACDVYMGVTCVRS